MKSGSKSLNYFFAANNRNGDESTTIANFGPGFTPKFLILYLVSKDDITVQFIHCWQKSCLWTGRRSVKVNQQQENEEP